MEEVFEFLETQPYEWEVIVVNDASTDESRKLVGAFVKEHEGFRLVDIPHGGKPAAIWNGIQVASGEVILFTDHYAYEFTFPHEYTTLPLLL